MRKLGAGIISLLCLAATAGCTTNKSIANVTFNTQATLEMAVGTINDPGGLLAGGGGTAGTNLNVVTSFRNQLGNSAYEHPGTPTLTGPGGAIAFVQCASLFSYGQAPGCNGILGVPPAYNPPSAVGGYATGFIITNAPPTSGAYSLSNATTVNGGVTTYTATATLPGTPTVLPVDGGLVSFTTDNLGGGSFTINQPVGVTESLIVVTNVASGNEVASVETTGTTGTITGTGSSCTGATPNGVPIPCGAFTVIVIGADYPLVEAGPPANTLPNPTLTASGGSADLTIGGGASSE